MAGETETQRIGFSSATVGAGVGKGFVARGMEGEPVTLAEGRAVLVELPFTQWPPYTEQVLFVLQTAGFQPILAHPERYAAVQRDCALALRLAERGVALQVSIGSLAGFYGRRAQQAAEELIQREAVTVVASDAHTAGRIFDHVGHGIAKLRELCGSEIASLLIHRPRALLEGQSIILPSPSSASPSEPRWRRLLRGATPRRS